MDRAATAGWATQDHRPDTAHYEYRLVTFDPSISRADARTALTDEAEYGRWELARTSLYAGGLRRVWLRRKIIRMRSTL